MVTSYGKSIHAGKIDALLREIPGIAEAVVVGEGKLFCTALMWARGRLATAARFERGDLTGNLTLKRAAIRLRVAPLIEAMYNGGPVEEARKTLHAGAAHRESA